MNERIAPQATPSADVASLLDAGQRLAHARAAIHKSPARGGQHFVILRDETGKERIEQLPEISAPLFGEGTVQLHDAASFAEYVRRLNAGPSLGVYATLNPAKFVAVFDDHVTAEQPGWKALRAEYAIEHSVEWITWTKHNGEGAAFGSTGALAKFLEENAPDITEPNGAVMQEIALNFRINSEVSFASAERLQNGQVELLYNNIVDGHSRNASGRKIGIPERFRIEIPVWRGMTSSRYTLDARFRYRLRDQKLALWYELVRPHKVLEQAFHETWKEIEGALKTKILFGSP